MLRTTTSSTPGPPTGSTRRRGPSCSPRPAPATSSPRRSTTTASRCGTHPAPATRNTVHRGPRRDLVREIADAVRAVGLRFGVYYSGGLDWSITDFPPHQTSAEVHDLRPVDAAYNAYALLHVRDLIDAVRPDVLWNDIDWPDAGKRTGAWSLHELFTDFYAGRPDGVVNDRWGDTHWDFRTTEYSGGHRARVRGPVGELPRDRLLVRLQPGRGNRPAADRPPAGPAARRPRVPRRAAAAQRRTDRRGGDPGRPAGVAARTRPLDLRPR